MDSPPSHTFIGAVNTCFLGKKRPKWKETLQFRCSWCCFTVLFTFFYSLIFSFSPQASGIAATAVRAGRSDQVEKSQTVLKPPTELQSDRLQFPPLCVMVNQCSPNSCQRSIKSCSHQELWSCQVQNKHWFSHQPIRVLSTVGFINIGLFFCHVINESPCSKSFIFYFCSLKTYFFYYNLKTTMNCLATYYIL